MYETTRDGGGLQGFGASASVDDFFAAGEVLREAWVRGGGLRAAVRGGIGAGAADWAANDFASPEGVGAGGADSDAEVGADDGVLGDGDDAG